MILYRAFASHPSQAGECMVFFHCRETEHPGDALLARLSLIWGIDAEFLDAYNVWSEDDLRKNAMGAMEVIGYDARLFEVGCSNGNVIYENSLPLFLVGPELNACLYAIWQKLPRQQEAA